MIDWFLSNNVSRSSMAILSQMFCGIWLGPKGRRENASVSLDFSTFALKGILQVIVFFLNTFEKLRGFKDVFPRH